MAQGYYTLEEAAKVAGISTEELNRLAQKREIRAFSDGGKWKFRHEDIEAFARERAGSGEAESDEQVLLDESALAVSGGAADGSDIGLGSDPGKAPSDSDVKLAMDDSLKVEVPSSATEFDLSGLESSDEIPAAPPSGSDSDLTRALDKISLEDESDIGLAKPSDSDITSGADSGINLGSPADSGISLERVESESDSEFELSLEGEEDDLFSSSMQVPTFKDEEDDEGFKKPPTVAKAKAPTPEKKPAAEEPSGSDSDFDLAIDEEYETEEESGSEVVALEEGEEAEEAFGEMEDQDEYAEEMPVPSPGIRGGLVAANPPWPGWVLVPCTLTTIVLGMVGLMLLEIMRFAWSSNTEITISAKLIGWFAGVFGRG
jgi:excisionase family DNA binding protein